MVGTDRSKFVRAFGLFPVEGSQVQKYAPELYVACQYMNSNNQSVSDRFGKIISAMKTLSKYTVNMVRLKKKTKKM